MSIADIRLAASLEFLHAIDYPVPGWLATYWSGVKHALGAAYAEPPKDVEGYIAYVKGLRKQGAGGAAITTSLRPAEFPFGRRHKKSHFVFLPRRILVRTARLQRPPARFRRPADRRKRLGADDRPSSRSVV